MKQVIFILLLFPAMAYSQQSKEPFKKATTIIIPIEGSQEDAYRKMAGILAQNGFGIAHSDASLGTISTTEKGYKNGTVKLNILVTSDNIRMNGSFTIDAVNMTSPIMYKGMKGSPVMNAWNEMQSVANEYTRNLLYAAN